jgi:membrane fusion protein (multidrug efflux system)
MKLSRGQALILLLISLSLSACNAYREKPHDGARKITVGTVSAKAVTVTQQYVCQIRWRRHIDVCALKTGYLEAIPIKEGQAVKEGELLFEIVPSLYKARREAAVAERNLAAMELNHAQGLANKQGSSQDEVKRFEAKLAKAQAKADLAEAELKFTKVRAPFDGVVDRLKHQGSLVKEGEVLGTLSDSSVVWVDFNVPEARYLEHMTDLSQPNEGLQIELILADGKKFGQVGKIDPSKGVFNRKTGTIPVRADFPNPDRLLRQGQRGTVLIRRVLDDAIVIPQTATLEVLNKRYVYVVDKNDVAHQREIVIEHELEDLFVIKQGVGAGDKIVLEGVSLVRDGEKVEYEDRR